ncbi:MAG: multicopper oxidase domain-containing protein [Candidatus Riflebacteria bacterium]|nr:multicopper oxidase domain-containing protein [Candidatus Riflebacteria bacterium]
MNLTRRSFLRGLAGGAAVIVGPGFVGRWTAQGLTLPGPQVLRFHVTDALKGMVTDNSINSAKCYFWTFREESLEVEVPGPLIYTAVGQQIDLSVTNDLDEPHAFFVPGMFDTGPIAPGQTFTGSFTPTVAGSFLYYDNLNAPVNRVMGLHGAMVVMPATPAPGHRYTPYSAPTLAVQKLFDDLGAQPWWPGLAWEEGDSATSTPPFRQHVWVLHQASPNLFREVGSLAPGVLYDPQAFIDAFTNDPFTPVPNNNRTPQYFTINGQSGHFAHDNPVICPMHRVGEPAVVRMLNAGLWTHSMHLHANHEYVIGVDGVPQSSLIWIDVFTLLPMRTVEWLVPLMRPPDIPNQRGIGRADPGLRTLAGGSTWPPAEELVMQIPGPGQRSGQDQNGNPIDLAVEMAPLCYPMHDHSEPSQTAQGGNYNCGLISGLNFIGDRNQPQGVVTFPGELTTMALHEGGPEATGPAAGPATRFHG